MNPPQFTLKAIVCVHFVLLIWGAQYAAMMPPVYLMSNIFVLLIGLWAIACPESVDAIIMFLVLHLFTILEDIILLGIYQPRARVVEHTESPQGILNEYRFSLGMSITNLILKPFSFFLMWRIYQDRGGRFSDLNIPGLPSFGSGHGGGNYENIDQPVPSNNVETAHSGLEKPPMDQ